MVEMRLIPDLIELLFKTNMYVIMDYGTSKVEINVRINVEHAILFRDYLAHPIDSLQHAAIAWTLVLLVSMAISSWAYIGTSVYRVKACVAALAG